MGKRILTKFGIEIKKKLIEKQMTQSKLAEKVGTNKNYLTDIMYGKHPLFKSKVAIKILNELDLDISIISKQ